MRFASIGTSNASNYAAAGKAVADSSARVFDAQRKTGPDYAELSKTAMKTASAEKIAAMKAESEVYQAGLKQIGNVKEIAINETARGKIGDIKKGVRKAGVIAGIGAIAGTAYLASRDNEEGRERPKDTTRELYEAWLKNHKGIKARHDQERDELGDGPEYTPYNPNSGTGGGSGGKVTTGSTSGASSTNNSGPSFDMSKLTTKDFDDLAFAISSEAKLGTDDEYGVAANILTRLQSGKYGSTVSQIINAPGQYEGVYKGLSVASPDISARLQSPEGRAKIQEFIKRLNGRTEFKGQTMLRNRVESEDPMFHPEGNFYHYAGQ